MHFDLRKAAPIFTDVTWSIALSISFFFGEEDAFFENVWSAMVPFKTYQVRDANSATWVYHGSAESAKGKHVVYLYVPYLLIAHAYGALTTMSHKIILPQLATCTAYRKYTKQAHMHYSCSHAKTPTLHTLAHSASVEGERHTNSNHTTPASTNTCIHTANIIEHSQQTCSSQHYFVLTLKLWFFFILFKF